MARRRAGAWSPHADSGCREVGNHHWRLVRVVEGSGRRHKRRITAHKSTHVGWMMTQLMAARSRETQDHSGEAPQMVELPEVDISGFEKIKSKNFKKGSIRCWKWLEEVETDCLWWRRSRRSCWTKISCQWRQIRPPTRRIGHPKRQNEPQKRRERMWELGRRE